MKKKDNSLSKIYIGIVFSTYYEDIVSLEYDSCLRTLVNREILKKNVFSISVPGALEIPCALKMLANLNRFDALIALGAVVRGETFHFEVVSMNSSEGLMRVSLDYNLPIINGILTVDNKEQAIKRSKEKGEDCANVAIEMINFSKKIEKKLCS